MWDLSYNRSLADNFTDADTDADKHADTHADSICMTNSTNTMQLAILSEHNGTNTTILVRVNLVSK